MSFFGIQLNAQVNKLMFEIRLNLAKNKHMPNIRTIFRTFIQYDNNMTGLVAPFHLQKTLNANGIFMKKYDVQVFQKAYNQNGKINWFNFLNHLKEPMGPSRRQLVQKIFDSMDQQRKAKLQTEDLMSHFNFNQIQTFRYGKKSKQQITAQFLSMLNVHQNYITREQFISFYDDLSINFVHNQTFFRYVSQQWHYTPQIQKQVKQIDVRKYVLALRNKLIQRTQATKDQYLIDKLFKEFDQNGNYYLGPYQLDKMVKKLGLSVEARYIDSLLAKMDGNRSGYVEFDDFKKFLFNNPYPY